MKLKEIYESIAEYLKHFFGLHSKNDSGLKGNDVYISMAENDEEREDIKELCEEIDIYYEERKRLKSYGKKAYKYLELRALEMYDEAFPDATEDERTQFLFEIQDGLDKAIKASASAFPNEYPDNDKDDTKLSELFLAEVERMLNEGKNADISDLLKLDDEKRKEDTK